MTLIDRDAVLKTIPSEEMVARMAVMSAPTVDAVPVRHGKWINFEHGDDKYYCDKCQTIWESGQIKNMHYCPTCGAKMDAGETE